MFLTLSQFLAQRVDFLLFALAVMVVLLLTHWIAFRRFGSRQSAMWQRIGLVIFLGGSYLLVENSEQRERERMRAKLEGILPTYAAELQRMGHEAIKIGTPPEDERYIKMIEAEKLWLHVNHGLRDVYTLRREGLGKARLIVDSETDYDRSGTFEGPREQRTEIGEPLETNVDTLDRAWTGERVFDESPPPDRWGQWVSAYAPLRDKKGQVEALIGADMDILDWLKGIREARMTMLRYLGTAFVLMTLIGTFAGIHSLSAENARQMHLALEIENSRSRLEGIINSIDGIVWEWDPANEKFMFVSEQSRHLMGFDARQLKEDPHRWCQNVHPDDNAAAKVARAAAVAASGSYSVDYRYLRPDGATVWLRERGLAMPASKNYPLCIRGILMDITTSHEEAEKLEGLNKQLVETSRQAGMAEVASGVLHNVGNVLNSVNVSSTVINDIVRDSKVQSLQKLATLLISQEQQIGDFFTNDPRGKAVPKFMLQLCKELGNEHQLIVREMSGLSKNITHIRQIVMMQQSFARTGGNTEPIDVTELLEDALRINESTLARHGITIVRDYASVSIVTADRNKVMQILINLIRNAKQAMQESAKTEHLLTLSIRQKKPEAVSICITDDGCGMTPETLSRIFSYGFTTKKDGHGFGLYSGLNTAREMGGSLTASSAGIEQGSTFELELPAAVCAWENPKKEQPPAEEVLPPMPLLPLLTKATPPSSSQPSRRIQLPPAKKTSVNEPVLVS